MSLIVLGGRRLPKVELVYSLDTGDNVSQYTFSGANLGAAHHSRLLVVCVASMSLTNSGFNGSVTIGGESLTRDVQQVNTGNSENPYSAIFSKAIPAGTSANIVVSFTVQQRLCVISVYRIVNLRNNVRFDRDPIFQGDGQQEMSINVPEKGIVIGAATTTSNVSWTGLTEDYEKTNDGWGLSSASAGPLSAETGKSVIASGAGRNCVVSYH